MKSYTPILDELIKQGAAMAIIDDVNRHNRLYNLDRPEISDKEYDDLLKQIPANQRPIGYPDGKIKHNPPMLSLSGTWDNEALQQFFIDTASHTCVGEPKIDGMAVSLIYVGGRLVQAITRGNGEAGRDITGHCLSIPDIPNTIQHAPFLIVRGEIYIEHAPFSELKYSTPRQAASSIMRKKSGELCRLLRFLPYEFASQADTYINSIIPGFQPMPEQTIINGFSQALAYSNRIDKTELPYPIDGVVFKINSLSARSFFGVESGCPNWAIAHKFYY